MGELDRIARRLTLKTTTELRELIGTQHPPCPTCGGGFFLVQHTGDVSCAECNPIDKRMVSFMAMLVWEEGAYRLVDKAEEDRREALERERGPEAESYALSRPAGSWTVTRRRFAGPQPRRDELAEEWFERLPEMSRTFVLAAPTRKPGVPAPKSGPKQEAAPGKDTLPTKARAPRRTVAAATTHGDGRDLF